MLQVAVGSFAPRAQGRGGQRGWGRSFRTIPEGRSPRPRPGGCGAAPARGQPGRSRPSRRRRAVPRPHGTALTCARLGPSRPPRRGQRPGHGRPEEPEPREQPERPGRAGNVTEAAVPSLPPAAPRASRGPPAPHSDPARPDRERRERRERRQPGGCAAALALCLCPRVPVSL